MKLFKTILLTLTAVFLFTACSSKRVTISQNITSNINGVEIYGGSKKSKLYYQCKTPCHKPFTGIKPYYKAFYYEARKKGYKTQIKYKRKGAYGRSRFLHFNMLAIKKKTSKKKYTPYKSQIKKTKEEYTQEENNYIKENNLDDGSTPAPNLNAQ